ncbi:MAG: alkaline phosphatase family protein [Candidatus Bathyarchaeota archaeon]|nr:alkaline phosphatase family protein [Candidatus Bathyarchaeota archaeon]
MSSEKRKKVLLIGVDGAEPTIIFDLAQRGILENFQNLMRTGSYGKLRSTIPPHTVPAWTSSVTGVNPGKHGLYDFFLSLDLRSKRPEYANSTKRKVLAVWNILSEHGKKVVVLNVPVTYPPEKVEGVMVSGMLTPSLKSSFTYPSSLKEELLDLGYQIDLGGTLLDLLLKRTSGRLRMLSSIVELIRNRKKAAKYLMKEFDWDFFMVVFVGLDRLQHWYWNFIDSSHIAHREKESRRIYTHIVNVYINVDKAIGELISTAGRQTNTIVYSDHGFRPVNRFFFTNNFLKQEELLATKKGQRTKPTIGQEEIFKVMKTLHLEKFVGAIPNSLKRKIGTMVSPASSLLGITQVDMNCTKAFQFSNFIRINSGIMSSQEEERTVEEVASLFSKLNLGIEAYPREKVFRGPETGTIPRIVLLPTRDVNPSQLLPLDGTLEMDYNPSMRVPSLMRCGDHSLYGVLVMSGPQTKGKTKPVHSDIVDVAPTVLHIMDEEIPEHIEGHPR